VTPPLGKLQVNAKGMAGLADSMMIWVPTEAGLPLTVIVQPDGERPVGEMMCR